MGIVGILSADTLYCKVTLDVSEHGVRIAGEATSHHWARCDLRAAVGRARLAGFGGTARLERLARPGRVPGLLGLVVRTLSAVLPMDGLHAEGLRSAGSDRPRHQCRS